MGWAKAGGLLASPPAKRNILLAVILAFSLPEMYFLTFLFLLFDQQRAFSRITFLVLPNRNRFLSIIHAHHRAVGIGGFENSFAHLLVLFHKGGVQRIQLTILLVILLDFAHGFPQLLRAVRPGLLHAHPVVAVICEFRIEIIGGPPAKFNGAKLLLPGLEGRVHRFCIGVIQGIPMINDSSARSLNLSNSVAIAVYEVLRRWDFPELLCEGKLTKYEW